MGTKSYPSDTEKLKKLADEGDPGAKWLLEKIKYAEIARAIWMLSKVEVGQKESRGVMREIAEAFFCYIADAESEARKEEGDFHENKVRPVFKNLWAVLRFIEESVDHIVANR